MMQSDACSFSVASELPYKFTGKERDAESGLDNFNKRYFGSRRVAHICPTIQMK
jgi:hypothetical protein